MNGIRLSAAWAIGEAAEALVRSSKAGEREIGRALRCCEVVGLDRASGAEKQSYTQGVRVSLRFYDLTDLEAVGADERTTAQAVAEAMGLWESAVQLDIGLIDNADNWLGSQRPNKQGGDGRRLDRYLTSQVLERLEAEKKGLADWKYLAERDAEVRILLRRIRYRFVENYGSEEPQRSYAFWTTGTTEEWANRALHQLPYLVSRLSDWSDGLERGNADAAGSLHPGYWGEVNTEGDPLRVLQLTTPSGATAEDVLAVFDPAGQQILLETETTDSSDMDDPLAVFLVALEELVNQPEVLNGFDVLLVHRGGGLAPKWRTQELRVTDSQKDELLALCLRVRDLGIEVVVALGHADMSTVGSGSCDLPLGVFEATTPTAGASWILQEHLDPRLVDSELIFRQR